MKSQALIHIPLALGFKHKLREFRTDLDSAHNLSWKLLLFLLSVALLDGRFRYGRVHYIGNKTCWTPPLAGQNAQLFTHTQLCQTLRTIKRFLRSTRSAVRQKQALKCSSNWYNTTQYHTGSKYVCAQPYSFTNHHPHGSGQSCFHHENQFIRIVACWIHKTSSDALDTSRNLNMTPNEPSWLCDINQAFISNEKM